MKAIASIILAALFAATPSGDAGARESGAFYRVEVIVFTHTGGRPDAWPDNEFENFAVLHDPLAKADAAQRRESEGAGARTDDVEATLELIDTLAELEKVASMLPDALHYPEAWIALDDLSPPMNQAREQLLASGEYQPRAHLAWYQPLSADTRSKPVRIHDDEIIDVEWVGIRPDGIPVRNGQRAKSARLLMPRLHYRIDGSIHLRQQRYLHLETVLHWREPAAVGPFPVLRPFNARRQLQVHRLDHSRTIRPERLEYFDSEWLGLLVRIEPFELEKDEDEDQARESRP